MKRVVLYTNSSSLNEATRHYIGIINKAASDLGYIFYITESISNIKFSDIILTIVPNNFFASFLFPPAIIILLLKFIILSEFTIKSKPFFGTNLIAEKI